MQRVANIRTERRIAVAVASALIRVVALCVLWAATPAIAAPKPWESLPLPPEVPVPSSSGYVEVKDAKLYYASYGPDDGDPVILLHGGLGNGEHWGFQLPALSSRYRVIAIDSRNHGRSTLSAGALSYHAMADDVAAVMDALSIKSAAFVGWSDGGEIAIDLAIHQPQRVRRMFVFGANYDASGAKDGSGTATFAKYAAKCRRDYARMAKNPRSFDAVVASLTPVWRSRVIFTKDQLRAIRVPTVVAVGEYDEVIRPEQVKEMATLIPSAQLVVFKAVSHFVLWQDPATFNQAVLDFLAAH